MEPVRSLRDDTRARALRRARTCYGHLAGELGVGLLAGLLRRDAVSGHDGTFRDGQECLSAGPAPDPVYQLTGSGVRLLEEFGLDQDLLRHHQHALRHCVDWSEQRHHLAGPVGTAIGDRMLTLGWVRAGPVRRSLVVTVAGHAGLLRERIGS
jgi:hypothetical protein